MRFLTKLAKVKTLKQLSTYIFFIITILLITPEILTLLYIIFDNKNLELGEVNWIPIIFAAIFLIPILLIIIRFEKYTTWCSVVAESIGMVCVYWDDRSQCLKTFDTYNPIWFKAFVCCYKATKEHYLGKNKKVVIKVVDRR